MALSGRVAAWLLVAGFAVAGAARAQAIVEYHELALSPGGDRVATVDMIDDADAEVESHGRIVVRATRDGEVLATLDPCATCVYAGLTFAPDGSLAFVTRDRKAGEVALGIARGAVVAEVVRFKGDAQDPHFSPDGRRIALLVTPGARKEGGAREAGAAQVGEIGVTSDRRRIAVFDVAARGVKDVAPLSPADRYVYEYAWTPDGRGFVATTAVGDGDASWWVATLDAIDGTTGAVRSIAKPAVQLNFPTVSPDGRTVAYIGGLMSDFGSVGGDLWTVPFAGGTPVNRTDGVRATALSLDWKPAGLRASALTRDTVAAVAYDDAGRASPEWGRAASMSAAGRRRIAWSDDGRTIATVVQDFEHAPSIHAGPADAPKAITHDNDAIAPLVSARSIGWNSDSYDVQGWLVAPRDDARRADPAKKAALITIVHGGPSAANMPMFVGKGITADLVAAGYWLFLPNPRGSFGQGEAFTAANRRDFGGGDLRDILGGIDAAAKIAPIDEARLGLTGGSYGGFMAMWANTQTDRFKAIAAGAGLSNWVSYYGTNGINAWMLPFFGKTMYEDRKAYEDVSAINFIRAAKTPTFIYVGERDVEVPPSQSVEYWHALKDMGVPTSLVIYPGEGHGIRSHENRADLRRRLVAWFRQYLGS